MHTCYCIPFLQLEDLPQDEKVNDTLRDDLVPYIYEAGLDTVMLNNNRRLLVQGLVVYFVIHKRRRELDNIAKGTYYRAFVLQFNG